MNSEPGGGRTGGYRAYANSGLQSLAEASRRAESMDADLEREREDNHEPKSPTSKGKVRLSPVSADTGKNVHTHYPYNLPTSNSFKPRQTLPHLYTTTYKVEPGGNDELTC